MVLRVGPKVFGQLRDPFRQQRDLHVSAARVLLMQLELLEIRRSGVLSHKRGRYCRVSPSIRKFAFAGCAAAISTTRRGPSFQGPRPTTAATTPERKRDIPTVRPAGIHGSTRKIVFDGIRELLMSL
jgi:hypothetical protein